MELIAVVMHCKTSPDRFESAKALLNYGFANYAIVDPMENVTLEAVPVVLGTRDVVQVEASGAGTVLLDKALAGSVTCTAELDESDAGSGPKGAAARDAPGRSRWEGAAGDRAGGGRSGPGAGVL